MTCTNLRFGIENQIPNMTLSASPAPVTDINYLKNEYSSRQAVWSDATAETVITGTLPQLEFGEYFAMAGSNLVGEATTKLELFNDGASQTSVVFDGGENTLSEQPPLGEWRAGIDPYGVPRSLDNPILYLIWFDQAYQYDSFKLTINNPALLPAEILDIRIRMLMLGEKFELQKNFSFGAEITFVTPPELVRTASGSYLPSRAQRANRRLDLNLDHMTDSDRSLLWQMERTLNNEAFVVSAFPDKTGWQYINYNFLGRLANSLTYAQRKVGFHRVNNLTIVEV